MTVVALLTDFGLADHYVATMKGVILSQAPATQFVDVTHNIPPQNVRAGAYQLLASFRYHPAGTLFLCVVDPGVGSNRRLLYAEAGGWKFMAPDNGLLSWVFEQQPPSRVFDISNPPGLPEFPSHTFHGRDILAPVAGRLLNGEPIETFGQAVEGYEKLPFPAVKKVGSFWRGQILAVDGFGNLVTNIRSEELAALATKAKPWFEFKVYAGSIRGLSESYASVEPGKLLALAGSAGFIEISVRDGNAAAETRLAAGDEVQVHFRT
jgi:S-adenosyl-L-methionine hydrolase (adenosine-forming)